MRKPSNISIWTERVNAVMDHIRANLSEDLHLNNLARVVHSSPYHFHRIFKAISGETIAAFTRRARLERAAYLMKSSPKRKLSSIALDVGFPALSEFSRAFKRQHGISPSEWDRVSYLHQVPECLPDATNGLLPSRHFDVQINRYSSRRLAYIRMQTWFEVDKLKVGFEKLTRWLAERGISWQKEEMIGMSWDHYQTTPLEQIRYDLAFPVSDDTEAEGEIGIYTLPAFQAAEAHCQGDLSIVAEAWDFLYDHWLARSSYEPRDLPAMKRFVRRPDEIGWGTWDLKCSIALVTEHQ